MTLMEFVAARYDQILTLLMQHIMMTFLAVALAVLVGVPIGILIYSYSRFNKPVLGMANLMQAIPSMALLGFLVPIIGIGNRTAIFMVVLYSLLPIIKNTYTGLNNINDETIEAAQGIGMTNRQILAKVQFPLALPVIMAGIRISSVTAVGLMTIASYIGAGGLGFMMYSGVQTMDTNMILSGAIPACVLALGMDFIMGKVEKAVTPVSLRMSSLNISPEEVENARRSSHRTVVMVAAALLLVSGGLIYGAVSANQDVVVVGSKGEVEGLIIGNILSDMIEEHTDLEVKRSLGLGGTQIIFNAILSNQVDLYGEYTGTAYASVLKQPIQPGMTPEEVLALCSEMFKSKYNLTFLPQFGFNNTYVLGVDQQVAQEYNLETLSQLALVSNKMRIAAGIEFANRQDGALGLKTMYNMDFKEILPMASGLRYEAVAAGQCEVVSAASTEGMIKKYNLKLLQDDKGLFPPYFMLPVIRQETLDEHPEIAQALALLENQISDAEMLEMNYQVAILSQDPAVVAHAFLQSKGLIK